MLLLAVITGGAIAASHLFGVGLGRWIDLPIVLLVIFFNVWLLTRIVAWGVRLAQPPAAAQPAMNASPPVAPKATTAWSILGWMLVGLLGVGLSELGCWQWEFSSRPISPAYQARMAASNRSAMPSAITPELEDRLKAALALANDTSRHNVLVRLAEEAAKRW